MNNKPIETFSVRLRKALSIRNMKQVDLVEKTKISKGSINQYVTGYSPNCTTERLHLIAKALDVNPVWLMGYDVPMESSATYNSQSADYLMNAFKDDTSRTIIQMLNKMDLHEKESILQYATFILSQRK